MLLSENTCWFDIGEMDSDKYDDEQQILKEFSLPSSHPVMPMLLPNLQTFDEDIPF